MNAVIVCSGTILDYSAYGRYFDKASLIISADGGAAHLRRFGVTPHILLGDFDSAYPEDLQYFVEQGVKIQQYPVQKDMTDTELAAEYAVEHGCDTVYFIGATGSRLDHTAANLLMLVSLLQKGIHGYVVNENNEITVIDSQICLREKAGWKISLIPVSPEVTGVTTRGLVYPLQDATMKMGTSWGVSNEFAEEEACISLRSGHLLVITARD